MLTAESETQELESAVERQCCPNRIYNQCGSRGDCIDMDSTSG